MKKRPILLLLLSLVLNGYILASSFNLTSNNCTDCCETKKTCCIAWCGGNASCIGECAGEHSNCLVACQSAPAGGKCAVLCGFPN